MEVFEAVEGPPVNGSGWAGPVRTASARAARTAQMRTALDPSLFKNTCGVANANFTYLSSKLTQNSLQVFTELELYKNEMAYSGESRQLREGEMHTAQEIKSGKIPDRAVNSVLRCAVFGRAWPRPPGLGFPYCRDINSLSTVSGWDV